MKKQFGAIALAGGLIGLAACAQETATQTFDLSLYPACSDVQSAADAPEGCVLADEGMLHAVLATHSVGTTRLQVVADGAAGQLIEEASSAPMYVPAMEDLNGDTTPDLLVPLDTGNVNTRWAVYLAGPDATYTRGGEITGVGWGRTESGFLAVPARSNAATVVVDFFDVEPGGLTEVASVTVEAQQSDPGAPIETVCVLSQSPAIAVMGLSEEQAQAQFCAEPIVTGTFR